MQSSNLLPLLCSTCNCKKLKGRLKGIQPVYLMKWPRTFACRSTFWCQSFNNNLSTQKMQKVDSPWMCRSFCVYFQETWMYSFQLKIMNMTDPITWIWQCEYRSKCGRGAVSRRAGERGLQASEELWRTAREVSCRNSLSDTVHTDEVWDGESDCVTQCTQLIREEKEGMCYGTLDASPWDVR